MHLVLAEGDKFVTPGPADFNLPEIFPGAYLTKPMLLVILSAVIIAGFFLMATSRMTVVPGKRQFLVEQIYDFTRNGIARDQIGAKDFRPYIPLIFSLFTFVLLNNIYGIIPLFQFPTMSHIGFALALSVLVVYPVYHISGMRRHGVGGYLKKEIFPSGVPAPIYLILSPIEVFTKFIMNPITLAIRVFAAMFAGHLILMVFSLGGEWMIVHGSALLKPAGVVSVAFAIALTFLEALIMVIQAYIFALLSASYIGAALAKEH